MRAYIKKLQSKSEETRKLIFTGLLIGSMSIVSLIWIYSLKDRFGSDEIQVQSSKDAKPFKLFGDSISSTFDNIKASVGNINFNSKKEEPKKQIDLIPVEPSGN